MILYRIAMGVSLCWLLTGCAGLINTGPAPDLYHLSPKSTFSEGLPDVAWQLVIEEPIAAGGLDTDAIAIYPSPTEVKYYAGARWTERAPKMIQTLLVESFENSNKVTAVGRQAIGLYSDYNLKTELREFQTEHFGGPDGATRVRVRLNAKIIKQPRQEIIASQNFESTVPVAKGEGMPPVIQA